MEPDGIEAGDGPGGAASHRSPQAEAFFDALRTPSDSTGVPPFAAGWARGDGLDAYLFYTDLAGSAWSDDLEDLHEESSRDHFMDVLTRRCLIEAVMDSVPDGGVVADLGCSTGYLLEDLSRTFPDRQLVGVDVVASGLRQAHCSVPDAALLLADVCDLPIGDSTVAAVVSANMLEHVADDVQALNEIRRILVPGGSAALIVPFGHNLYDYYDRFLGHERRYARGELAAKAATAGFEVLRVDHLGQLLYPPFWVVKKRNRLRRDHLRDEALREQVERDIAATTNSRLGALACRAERWFMSHGVRLPVGIRELVVLRRPMADT